MRLFICLAILAILLPTHIFASDVFDPEAGKYMQKHEQCVEKFGPCPDVEYARCTLEYNNGDGEGKGKNFDSLLPTKEILEKECFEKINKILKENLKDVCDIPSYGNEYPSILFSNYTTSRDQNCKCEPGEDSETRETYCHEKKLQNRRSKFHFDSSAISHSEFKKKLKRVKSLKDWKD